MCVCIGEKKKEVSACLVCTKRVMRLTKEEWNEIKIWDIKWQEHRIKNYYPPLCIWSQARIRSAQARLTCSAPKLPNIEDPICNSQTTVENVIFMKYWERERNKWVYSFKTTKKLFWWKGRNLVQFLLIS